MCKRALRFALVPMYLLEALLGIGIAIVLTLVLGRVIQRKIHGSLEPRRIDADVFEASAGVALIVLGAVGIARDKGIIGFVAVASGAAMLVYGIYAGAFRPR